MMVRFLAEGEAWSSAPDAGELWGARHGLHRPLAPVASSVLDCHAEVQPILCKESANREQDNKPALDCHAEVQPLFCKDRKIIYTVQLFPELLVIQTLNHDTSAHSSRASLPEPL